MHDGNQWCVGTVFNWNTQAMFTIACFYLKPVFERPT